MQVLIFDYFYSCMILLEYLSIHGVINSYKCTLYTGIYLDTGLQEAFINMFNWCVKFKNDIVALSR